MTDEKKQTPQEEVSEEKTLPIEKVAHKNIYSAFSAFQGELTAIKKNGKVSFPQKNDPTKTVEFSYATLDDIMSVVNPLLAKQGLAVTWELDSTKEDNGIECVLYHETSESKREPEKSTSFENTHSPSVEEELISVWYNVMRSGKFPIDITSGDMKDRGGNITYGRRYTIGVVLGIVSEEDTDVAFLEQSQKSIKNFAKTKIIDELKGITDREVMQSKIDFFERERLALKNGDKPTALGMSDEEYVSFIQEAKKLLETLDIK